MLKIATWNVNSVNARLAQLTNWLTNEQPDIVLLQELKCTNENFPTQAVEDLGYNLAINGQKTYNGTAILSRSPLEDISTSLTDDPDDSHARYIEAVTTVNNKVIRVASVYVPNGQLVGSDKFFYKLKFLDALFAHTKNLLEFDEIFILGGDFNVAPEDNDVYDPFSSEGHLCFHKDERAKYRALLSLGLTDSFRAIYPDKHEFSWWDYRAGNWQNNLGLRIDHLLLSPEAADLLSSAHIDRAMRGNEKASDHAPVICQLEI
jgi:exodeoxyribonuclease-3